MSPQQCALPLPTATQLDRAARKGREAMRPQIRRIQDARTAALNPDVRDDCRETTRRILAAFESGAGPYALEEMLCDALLGAYRAGRLDGREDLETAAARIGVAA